MIASYEFKILNKVVFSEIWPIEDSYRTLSFERNDGFITGVKVSFRTKAENVLPKITPNPREGISVLIQYRDAGFMAEALELLISWQASIVPFAPISIDFDAPKVAYTLEPGENVEDDSAFGFATGRFNDTVNCDFENVVKAFLIGPKSEAETQSLAFFREGRLAYLAGRYIDSYLNYFLYIETKYCNGKTGTKAQSDLLSKNSTLQKRLDECCSSFDNKNRNDRKLSKLYDSSLDHFKRFKSLVELRGELRHHSLKHKQRWDPNNHKPYEEAARFIGAFVGREALDEGISELYSATNEKKFFKAAERAFATTEVLNKIISIAPKGSKNFNIILPCKSLNPRAVANCIKQTIKSSFDVVDMDTVVRIEGIAKSFGLKAYESRLGPWCFSKYNVLELAGNDIIHVSVDYRERGGHLKNIEFEATQWLESTKMSMGAAWRFLEKALLHIETVHPPAEIHKVEIIIKNHRVPIVSYYVGSGALT